MALECIYQQIYVHCSLASSIYRNAAANGSGRPAGWMSLLVIRVYVAGKLIQIVCCVQHPQSQLQSGESAIRASTAQYLAMHVRCNYSKAHTYIQYTQAQATTISGTRYRSQPSARTQFELRRLTTLVRARNFSRSIKSHWSSKRPKNSKQKTTSAVYRAAVLLPNQAVKLRDRRARYSAKIELSTERSSCTNSQWRKSTQTWTHRENWVDGGT